MRDDSNLAVRAEASIAIQFTFGETAAQNLL